MFAKAAAGRTGPLDPMEVEALTVGAGQRQQSCSWAPLSTGTIAPGCQRGEYWGCKGMGTQCWRSRTSWPVPAQTLVCSPRVRRKTNFLSAPSSPRLLEEPGGHQERGPKGRQHGEEHRDVSGNLLLQLPFTESHAKPTFFSW